MVAAAGCGSAASAAVRSITSACAAAPRPAARRGRVAGEGPQRGRERRGVGPPRRIGVGARQEQRPDRLGGGARRGRIGPPGDRLEHRDTDGVDVERRRGSDVGRFGREVRGRARDRRRGVDPAVVGGARHRRMTGIDEQRPVVGQQHVRRLHVAVDDRLGVEHGQRLGDRREGGRDGRHRDPPVVDAFCEGRPVVEDEREVGLAVVLARIEEPDERRVVRPPEHGGLAGEAGGGERIFHSRAAELQRHDDAVAVGAPHLGVVTAAEVSLQAERTDPRPFGAPRGRTRPSSHSSHSLRVNCPTRSAGPRPGKLEGNGDAALAGRGR